MSTDKELRSNQKSLLFNLLKLERDNPNIAIVGLKELIIQTQAIMDAEDVSYVEKLISTLP